MWWWERAAVKVWLTHLEAGIRASHAARLFMRRQRRPRRPVVGILQRLFRRTVRATDPARPDAGNQLKPPGAGVDRQNNPRPFFCGFLSVPAER